MAGFFGERFGDRSPDSGRLTQRRDDDLIIQKLADQAALGLEPDQVPIPPAQKTQPLGSLPVEKPDISTAITRPLRRFAKQPTNAKQPTYMHEKGVEDAEFFQGILGFAGAAGVPVFVFYGAIGIPFAIPAFILSLYLINRSRQNQEKRDLMARTPQAVISTPFHPISPYKLRKTA